ncbi:pyocin knob domain-containing protein [Paenibacillus sp. FSL R10-2782]|uniref:phage tail protein n=1 Tax=Paenibacillus sp. FSL R10-2782 TaxID=2954661 RepID=UPI00315845B4
MSRYPWRDTSSDIAGGQPPQWETPGGAQAKADKAEEESKKYTDEKNADFTAHVQNVVIHVTQSDKDNWNSKASGVHTHANATPTTPGFESAADKAKLDGIEAGANNYVHPVTHPPSIIVQDTSNRFVTDAEKAAWDAKAETTTASPAARGLMSSADKSKLDGIESGAEVNQNAFATIKAPGQGDVIAGSKQETINFAGGTGITVTTDPASKKVMITATGEATPGPHASSHITGGTDIIPDAVTGAASGLMSGADANFVRNTGETKTGAQSKADAAKDNAIASSKVYTDAEVQALSTTIAEKTQDASLTKKGVVQLSKAVNGTRDDIAATESAVSSAYGLANSAYRYRGNAPANWNDATLSGGYNVALSAWTGYSNYPSGAYTYGKLIVNSDYGARVQMYVSHDSPGRVYFRISFNDTDWREWTEIFMTRGGDITGAFNIISNGGGNLALVGTDHVYMRFYRSGLANGRSGYFGYQDSRATAITLHNEVGDIKFTTSSGSTVVSDLVEMYRGVGSPEGVITAPVGALYRNRVGGAGSTLYIKESGSGNTGWRAV